MDFTPATPPTVAAFVGIVGLVTAALLWAVHRTWRSVKAVATATSLLAVWLGAQSALIASGRMSSLPLNGLPFFFGPILVIWTALAFLPVGGRIAANIPLAALVAFQAFRLPLELVLHSWAAQDTIPETMTWTGQSWDILSGIVALVCAPLASRQRAAAWLANLVGFALLLNVMRVAIMSSPVPFGWHTQPPLVLAFHLPYALIGPVCVGGALFGHLVLTRALLNKTSPQPSS